jgi:hypothetical protein
MKDLLLIFFSTLSVSAFAQSGKINMPTIVFERYAYIDGVRLDSIKSEYVEVHIQSDYVYVDYGQKWRGFANNRITDSIGAILRFDHITIGTTLNFMNYNGWEYVNAYYPPNAIQYFVFKKKKI